jgi:hypothetical protein
MYRFWKHREALEAEGDKGSKENRERGREITEKLTYNV